MREETLRQKDIFDIYYSLGDKRSFEKLREKLKTIPNATKMIPSLTILKRWSKKFDWQKRIQERDIELSKEFQKQTNQDIINAKVEYRKTINDILSELIKSLTEYQKKIESGAEPFQIESLRDLKIISQILDILIRLDLSISGEPSQQGVYLIISGKYIPEEEK